MDPTAQVTLHAKGCEERRRAGSPLAGFSVDETARALDVSVGTIGREQRLAEAWLHRELSQHSP